MATRLDRIYINQFKLQVSFEESENKHKKVQVKIPLEIYKILIARYLLMKEIQESSEVLNLSSQLRGTLMKPAAIDKLTEDMMESAAKDKLIEDINTKLSFLITFNYSFSDFLKKTDNNNLDFYIDQQSYCIPYEERCLKKHDLHYVFERNLPYKDEDFFKNFTTSFLYGKEQSVQKEAESMQNVSKESPEKGMLSCVLFISFWIGMLYLILYAAENWGFLPTMLLTLIFACIISWGK